MKTSNKILLTFLIVGFGFLTISRVCLYYKYIHKLNTPDEVFNHYYYNEFKLPALKNVIIENIAECQLYASTTPKLMIEKHGTKYASYTLHGDTLIVTGYTAKEQEDGTKLNRSPQEVNLYLPPGIAVKASRSNIGISGNITEAGALPYHITLDYSTLNTRVHFFRDTVNRYFDTVYITAKNRSGIYFGKHDFFSHVYTSLDSSEINDGKATINDFRVSSNSSSVIIATGNNITKLNTTGSTR